MKIKFILFKLSILIFFMSFNLAVGQIVKIPYKITASTAKILTALANDGTTKYINLYIDDESETNIEFHYYYGYAPTGTTFGFFAVNPWTGDVWTLIGCEKISTPASLKIQAKIKRRFSPSELKEYNRLSAIRPVCVIDHEADRAEDEAEARAAADSAPDPKHNIDFPATQP